MYNVSKTSQSCTFHHHCIILFTGTRFLCINLLLMHVSKKYDKRVYIILLLGRGLGLEEVELRGWFDQLGMVPPTKELSRLLITGPEPPDPVISIHDCDGDPKIAAVILAILFWSLFVFNEEG